MKEPVKMNSKKLFAPTLLVLMSIIRAQKIEPMCLGPGVWPHPQYCRLFSLCRLDDTSAIRTVTAQSFLCPPGQGFSAIHSTCVTSKLVAKCSQNTKSTNRLLESSTVPQLLRSTNTREFTCAGYALPYCDDSHILVLCGPNQILLGAVNCSAGTKMNSGVSLCDKKTNKCIIKKSRNYINNAKFLEFSMTSDIVQTESAMTTLSPTTVGKNKWEEQNHESEEQKGKESITSLQLTTIDRKLNNDDLINTTQNSNESSQNYFSNEDNTDNACKQDGLQCANNATIIDCPDDLSEPVFKMSCSDMIQLSNADEATGYCNNDISSCILKVNQEIVVLKLILFDIGEQSIFPDFLIKCSDGGLHCANNMTLVLCSGFTDVIDYAITCGSQETLIEGDHLKSYCDPQTESCVIETNDTSTSTSTSSEDNQYLTKENEFYKSSRKEQTYKFSTDNYNHEQPMVKSKKEIHDFHETFTSNLGSFYKENVGTTSLESKSSSTLKPSEIKYVSKLEKSALDITGKFLEKYFGITPNGITVCRYSGWQCLSNDILVFCSQQLTIYGFLSCSEAYKDLGNNIFCDHVTSKCVIQKEVHLLSET